MLPRDQKGSRQQATVLGNALLLEAFHAVAASKFRRQILVHCITEGAL